MFILVSGTDCLASKDPVIAQLPADGLVVDMDVVDMDDVDMDVVDMDVVDLDVVDMDVMENDCLVVPDVNDSCAVVAMIGLDMVRRREETPMNWDGECAEWDIRNEFETIDGMPVYYGGDLCDSDGSEWDDPWDLAYAEEDVSEQAIVSSIGVMTSSSATAESSSVVVPRSGEHAGGGASPNTVTSSANDTRRELGRSRDETPPG